MESSAWEEVAELAHRLCAAWGCWAPTLTADARRVAYVSDRRGLPELWVQDVADPGTAQVLHFSDDPVLAVRWSPDGRWLACSVATGGGVRTEVWVVRPEGTGAHRLAGGDHHAVLGHWGRLGHHLVATVCGNEPGVANRSVLIDPDGGGHQPVATGGLLEVLDLSPDERFALLRDGTRGAHYCRLLDRTNDVDHAVLPYPGTGSTDLGQLRPSPFGDGTALVAYMVTDAGRPLRALVATAIGPDGIRESSGALAERPDAELELADADAEGRRILLVWNVGGISEVEVLDAVAGTRRCYEDVPGDVVSGAVLARSGNLAVLSVESPSSPRRLWSLDVELGRWQPLTPAVLDDHRLVSPTLERFESHDGLALTGWLYRRPEAAAGGRATGGPEAEGPATGGSATGGPATGGPAVVSLHGGPEGQERPVFSPQHQVLVAAGITVFAPNIRGSSGFGHPFVHADDRYGRLDAIGDVAACADHLVDQGMADTGRIAVAGRSYGGYAVLMALILHPRRFAVGVDICGMSDLLTFYRDTEPWIARAAVTKYGDPDVDHALLASLSPLRHLDGLTVPLLVVHGELDTNVPISEARQLVTALQGLGRPVEYLQLDGEGHEYRHPRSRLRLVESMARFLSDHLTAEHPAAEHPAAVPAQA